MFRFVISMLALVATTYAVPTKEKASIDVAHGLYDTLSLEQKVAMSALLREDAKVISATGKSVKEQRVRGSATRARKRGSASLCETMPARMAAGADGPIVH